MGFTPIVATLQSEVGVRRFSKNHHLVGPTMSVVVGQSETDAFNARWWDIHSAIPPTNQRARRLGAFRRMLVGHTHNPSNQSKNA